jgi:AcrR family transcriptional regulator
MPDTQHEVEAYVSHITFPASKEELINGLLVRDAPARMVALVERLPRDRYDSRHQLREDLEEVARVHAREVGTAHTYDEFLAVVLRHVGDVRHTTKEAYNRVVEHVIHLAQQQGTLNGTQARAMQQRLDAAFADLRGTMSEVYDYQAPIDPHGDLPRTQP